MSRKRALVWTALVFLVCLAIAAVLAWRWARGKFTPDMMADIHAAIAARNTEDADARIKLFLEGRYGPLSDPANRERAFRAFFDMEHMKALEIISEHAPKEHRFANSVAMARWLENYRLTMTPQEKTDLGSYFKSPEGDAAVKVAGAAYMQQDVFYRANSTPVITELMTTLSAVRSQ